MWLKQKLINWALKRINISITPEDVFRIDKQGAIWLGNEKIEEMELRSLQGEIKALENMRLWRVLNETVRYNSVRMAVHEAQNWEQVIAGKMSLWVLGVFEDVIARIKRNMV